MALSAGLAEWPLHAPFRIARGEKTQVETLIVHVSDGESVGRGEAVPYARYGETPDVAVDDVYALQGYLDGPDDAVAPDGAIVGDPAERRARLQTLLAPGAARNALDCALWDLEAKRARAAGGPPLLPPPPPVRTAVTISLDSPDAMGAAAHAAYAAGALLLKIKVGAADVDTETARLYAVRAAAPAAALIIDANEGWDLADLATLDVVAAEIGALFIEQPLPAELDEALRLSGLYTSTPLCADESAHTTADLAAMNGLYQVINVKLDKCGGLTEALALKEAALAAGFEVMIGCMVAGSLATAPAFHLTRGALAVDLDGPLLLAEDVAPPIHYDGAIMHAPDPDLWG